MTRSLLQEHGLGVATSLGLAPDADLTSEDAGVRARGEALLMDALRVTADLGATSMCGVLYSALSKYDAPLTAQGRANVVSSLRRVARAAGGCGVDDETSRMLARLLVSADARADLGVAMRIAEADAAGCM